MFTSINIIFFFFNDTATTEIYTLSLHDALPISIQQQFEESGFPTTYTHFTDMGYQLDHLSVYDWIERYVEGGHDAPLGHLLNTACTGFYGLGTKEQSSLNLVYMFASQASEKRTP